MNLGGYTNFDFEYRKKAAERQCEIWHSLTFDTLTRNQRDALMLESIMLEIRPYSLNWRSGMVRVLQRAIKRVKVDIKNEQQESEVTKL